MGSWARLYQKNYGGTIRSATKGLGIDPRNVGLLNARAMAYNRTRKYNPALTDSSLAAMINPRSAVAYYNKGYALSGLGKRNEAMRELGYAARIDPRLIEFYKKAAALPSEEELLALFDGPMFGSPQGGAGAAGGMGVVYEAIDRGLDRKVAIKKMRDAIRNDASARERFLTEARLVAKLRHPNIVEIYAIETDGSDAYLIFEYVEGRTIAQMIEDRGRLSLEAVRPILAGVASALDYAHAHGVVHRDLKPANIMVDKSGTAKVMDFGVARQGAGQLTHLDKTNTVCGTPMYMAPEQEEGVVGRETDTYALGLCLYEMLTGRLPFSGTAGAMLLAKRDGKFTPVSLAGPGLPKELDAAINRALAPNPEDRFHSASELLQAFEAAAGKKV